MTLEQLESAVADALGESLGTVHQLGFRMVPEQPDDLEPEDLTLCIQCPFCRKPAPFPGTLRSGEMPLGECLACDVYFDVEPGDVFAAGSRTLV